MGSSSSVIEKKPEPKPEIVEQTFNNNSSNAPLNVVNEVTKATESNKNTIICNRLESSNSNIDATPPGSLTSNLRLDASRLKKAHSTLKIKHFEKIAIFFGSQSGTAEGFARTLAEEGKRLGYEHCVVIDLDDFEEGVFQKYSLSIFLVATYGEGDATDNAAKFFAWMKSSLELTVNTSTTLLSNVNFSVFGLGNSLYDSFNQMGKFTDSTLSSLGGCRYTPLGLGDDNDCQEKDFESWKATLWETLRLKPILHNHHTS